MSALVGMCPNLQGRSQFHISGNDHVLIWICARVGPRLRNLGKLLRRPRAACAQVSKAWRVAVFGTGGLGRCSPPGHAARIGYAHLLGRTPSLEHHTWDRKVNLLGARLTRESCLAKICHRPCSGGTDVTSTQQIIPMVGMGLVAWRE